MLTAALGLSGCRDDATPGQGGTDDAGDETGPGDDGESGMDDGADDTGTDSGGEEPAIEPPPGGMRRLLSHEYLASVELLLGPEAAAAALPPADGTVGGYDAVAAVELPLAPVAVEDYERSAAAVAEAAAAAPETIAQTVPCVTAGQGDDCYGTLVTDLGRLLWRRTLVDAEIDGLVAFAEQARDWGEGDFIVGVQYVIAAMLQSPNFVYVVEVGEPDPDGGPRRLTGPELATRMSLFLLGRTPDATLLDIADSGELDDPDGLRDVAWQLVDTPEAVAQVDRFYNALLELRDLEDKGKDTELFPVWDEFTAASMREETLRLVRHLVFEEDGDVLDMLDADYTFVDPRLAAIYGIESPGPNWTQTTLPAEQERLGILTHPSFLAAQSYTRRNSPTRRGLFVQTRLLCQPIAPPPPRVNPEPPEPMEGVTFREQLEAQTSADPLCGACHELMDPVGFAFEHFDPLGQRRELDQGLPIDASGSVPGLGEFGGAADLAGLLRDDPRVPQCLVDNLFSHTLGVSETWMYGDGLDALGEMFTADGHRFRGLMVELVSSPLFARVEEPR